MHSRGPIFFFLGGREGGMSHGIFGILCSHSVPYASIKVTKVFILFSYYSSSSPEVFNVFMIASDFIPYPLPKSFTLVRHIK